MKKTGYLLFECILVLSLLGILLSLVFINTQFTTHAEFISQVDLLYNRMIALQQEAMVSGTQKILHINTATHAYAIDDSIYQLPSSVRFGVIPDAKGPPSKPHALLSTPSTFSENTIIFYPDGIIKSGVLYITDQRKKSLYAISCAVGQVSFLRKYRYDKDKWILG